MSLKRIHDNYVGKGDYLTVIKDVNVYIDKFLNDLDDVKFRLTKDYLIVLGYKSTDYSSELLYDNILSKVYKERTNRVKSYNKTKKRENITNNKTLKGTRKLTGTNKKSIESNYISEDYDNAYRIQNKYRFIWYVYALYILFNEVISTSIITQFKRKYFLKFDKLYKINDMKKKLNLSDNVLNTRTKNKVKGILKEYLLRYFINPKIRLQRYLSLKETRKEINNKSNIYFLDMHGSIGNTFFTVPEKTIIIVNTSLNKQVYKSNDNYIHSLINNINKRHREYKDIDIYEITNNLYKLLVEKINPNASIYIAGQIINNMDLTISPSEFEPIISLKDNETISSEFKKLHKTKKTATTLYKLIGNFKPFNIGELKVIYLLSCNNTYEKNINVNYIYNYFLRITSPYSDAYSYNDNSTMMELTHAFDFINVETNNLVKSKRNAYVDLCKNILAGKPLDIIEKSYSLILPPHIDYVNHIYILLILITAYSYNKFNYYYKNHAENIDDALNYIFDKMYKFKSKTKRKDSEYTDNVLVSELKRCLELYIDDIKDYHIDFIDSIVILFFDNKKLDILETIINRYKHLITLDKYIQLISVYFRRWTNNDDIKLNKRLLKLLIDDKQEILKDEFAPINYYITICISKNMKLDTTIIKLLIDDKQEVLSIKDKISKLTPLELYNKLIIKYRKKYKTEIDNNIVKLLTPN
jgi:hypothetical protein